jgi:16S rRNA (cytosine1402-N4)-methyltransferase
MDEQHHDHIPVMLKEVMAYVQPQAGQLYMDGTFGRGGYTEYLLGQGARVIAVDRDPEAIAHGVKLKAMYGDQLHLQHGTFAQALKDFKGKLHGLVLDLGVSSPQIDRPERGFSFRFSGPLDMRMDPASPLTAFHVVNAYEEKDIAHIIFTLGEERASRRIAKTIVQARQKGPIETTKELASLVRSCMRPSKDGLDPSTRTFQALRLYVNKELEELTHALESSLSHLEEGGRLVVVSFHSLEDRLVKHFMRSHSSMAPQPSRHHVLISSPSQDPLLTLLTPRAIKPTVEECRDNPRASSARLRAAQYHRSSSRSSSCPV